MEKINNLRDNYRKRNIKSVIVTENGFDTTIELVDFKGRLYETKIVPYYEIKKVLISLGFKNGN